MIVKPNEYSLLDMKYAYIAGFFDGEGCIGVYRNGRYYNAFLRIEIANVDRTSLQFVKSILGGSIIDKPPTSERCKMCYRWKLGGTLAAEALEKLLPYLIIKKERAILGIECVGVSMEHQSEIKIKMNELNRRGDIQ